VHARREHVGMLSQLAWARHAPACGGFPLRSLQAAPARPSKEQTSRPGCPRSGRAPCGTTVPPRLLGSR